MAAQKDNLVDKSVMLLTQSKDQLKDLNRICQKLSITREEISPFVKRRGKELIEEQSEKFMNDLFKVTPKTLEQIMNNQGETGGKKVEKKPRPASPASPPRVISRHSRRNHQKSKYQSQQDTQRLQDSSSLVGSKGQPPSSLLSSQRLGVTAAKYSSQR